MEDFVPAENYGPVTRTMNYEMADEIVEIYHKEMQTNDTCNLQQVIDQVVEKYLVEMTPELRNGLNIGMQIMSKLLIRND